MQGFMALSIVLLISAVVMIAASSIALLGIGEGQISFAMLKGEDNLQFVEGCMEDALLKARSNSAFGPVNTPVTIIHPEGTCVITVLSKTGTNPVVWTMNAEAQSTSTYRRKVQVVFSRSVTGITLTSWKEIQ